MTVNYITALEHEHIPVGAADVGQSLTAGEANELSRLGELRPGFCTRGHRSVRLAEFCGIVNLGSRILEILPKVDDRLSPSECRGVLVRLLRQGSTVGIFRHLNVGQNAQAGPLFEVFISAFFDTVFEILRGGLRRQYRECEDDIRVVRGRIDEHRQFATHFNRPDQIACRFDELTADNVWNRSLKAALRAVDPWISTVDVQRRWLELMFAFDEVADTPVEARQIDRLVFDRQAARYRAAIGWARLILSFVSPSLRAGTNSAPGLLINMNELFQSAVSQILQRAAARRGDVAVESQESPHHLASVVGTSRWMFKLKPDLVARRINGVVEVGDTKWKRVEVAASRHLRPTESDMYQMHAYAAAYNCSKLALIYPWYAGLNSSLETKFRLPMIGHRHPEVSVFCLDVSVDDLTLMRGDRSIEFGLLLT